jgi:hypothetical protein
MLGTQSKIQRSKVEWNLLGAGVRGNWKLLFNGYRVSVWKDEKVLGTHSVNYTTM